MNLIAVFFPCRPYDGWLDSAAIEAQQEKDAKK